MKGFIRRRLKLLLENKKTTDTGVSKPDYGGGGDRVYYFNYGTLETFRAYLRVLVSEVFSKLTDKEKSQLFGVDTNIEYGNFEFKIRITEQQKQRLIENKEFVKYPTGSKLYHGTRHDVDKFSTEKIGTGEGAQVYGWGLYFTESMDIGHHYAFELSDMLKILVDGEEIKNENLKKIIGIVFKQVKDFYFLENKDVFIKKLNSIKRNFVGIGTISNQIDELKEVIFNANTIKVIPPEEAYIYEIETIKDLKLIDYDNIIADDVLILLNNQFNLDLKKDIFENVYRILVRENNISDKLLTDMFLSLGYNGIIFQAGRLTFERKSNSKNVVIFSDDSIRITGKQSIFY